MAWDENLLNNIREALVDVEPIEEKQMFGDMCFMVDDKLCVCVKNTELMCRINPEQFEAVLEMPGVRPMANDGKGMRGYVFVDENAMRTKKDFDHWIHKVLTFNKIAKASKKRK